MPDTPRQPARAAAEILADLRQLDRENDRLEHRLALAAQSHKAAEAHAAEGAQPAQVEVCLERAARQLRATG